MLMSVKGIGPDFAAVLWSEELSRSFSNRRQVVAYAGLIWRTGARIIPFC
jgi:transposase